MIDKKIHVAIASYRRAGKVRTIKVIPEAAIWVPTSQGQAYKKHYGESVVTIPDKLDGNICRKQNAILDRSPKKWTLILDDDITGFSSWENGVPYYLTHDQIVRMINHYFDLADQLGVRMWGINQLWDALAYVQFRPFAFLSPILGPFVGHLNPELRYDETVGGKDDYDFFLQNIRKYHRVLRVNKYFYRRVSGKQSGGLVSMRSKQFEWDGIRRMQEKWGKKVFRVGGRGGVVTDRETNPIGNILNAIVHVPIAGVGS